MDIEYNNDLSNIEDKEISDSDTVGQYMCEPIRRERDEDPEDFEITSSFDDHEFHTIPNLTFYHTVTTFNDHEAF